MIRNKSVSLMLGIFASLFWGLSFVLYKTAYLGFKPLTVVMLRLVIATVVLSIVLGLRREKTVIQRGDWRYFILLSLLEPFLYFLGESYGMQMVSSTLGALIIATIPLFTPLPAYLIHREKVPLLGIPGMALSFFGVALVAWNGRMDLFNVWGIPLMLLAVFSAIFYGTVLKKLSQTYSSLVIVRMQSAMGIVMFLPLFIGVEARHFTFHVPFVSWLSVILLAIFASCLAYMFISISIRNIGLNATNLLANLIPVFTAIIAYFVLQEVFTTIKIMGGMMVIAGVGLYQLKGLKRPDQSST